jgi:hypothetical protein
MAVPHTEYGRRGLGGHCSRHSLCREEHEGQFRDLDGGCLNDAALSFQGKPMIAAGSPRPVA